jgi:hypothetical protein
MMALFVNPARGQDERFWRKLLSGELAEESKKVEVEPKWVFSSPNYHLDLNSDGRKESLVILKRDGIDWLDVVGHDKSILFKAKLWAMGVASSLYRVRLVSLSKNVRVLVLYLYEGKTESKTLQASARLYFLSFENNDFSTFKLTPGPRFWHEFEGQREQYWRRLYSINVKDYDGDGTKDFAVEFNQMQNIWLYKGNGSWISF